MFANLMNNQEKEKFLELIYKIAQVDGNYAEEEEELVNNYKIELGLDEVQDTDSIDGLISYFGEKTNQLKKIVFFELYGMIVADDKIDAMEETICNKLVVEFGLNDDETEAIMSVAKELQEVYTKIYDVLF